MNSVIKPRWTFVVPGLRDPRIMVACAQTLWMVLGQTTYYFNRNPVQIAITLLTCCLLDMLITAIAFRQIIVPLSAYLTALSIGILLESYDWRIYLIASVWGILSKYLVRNRTGHFFNPSNFGLVTALFLCGDIASIAPGSQWGADYRIAVAILGLGLLMMYRLNRLGMTLAWISGYVLMSLLRMALGQGGLVFVLGPLTGAEFALFTFVMMPDPKASPPTRKGRIAWGLAIALVDGVMRYFEIRYSPFYALFILCSILPLMRWAAARAGLSEASPWRVLLLPFGRTSPGLPTALGLPPQSPGQACPGFSRADTDVPAPIIDGSR